LKELRKPRRRFTFESEHSTLAGMEKETQKRCFKHLAYEERVNIELMKAQRYSLRHIAQTLHRAVSSICDELNKKQVRGKYCAKKAHLKAYQQRYWSKYQSFKAIAHQHLIEEKLKLRLSPERIAGFLKQQGVCISSKAVYKFVHSRCLERYLWKPRKRTKRKATYLQDHRKFAVREPVFETGHFEMDFVVCSQNTHCLLVLVDRFSRFTFVQKLENKTKESLMRAFQTMTKRVSMKTVTTDNDIVFACWRELEQMFGVQIFFTRPYRSWEKPLVEQTNKLIRQFVPKKTNMRTVSETKLHVIDQFLNHTPRQCLNYATAYEQHYGQ